MGFGQWAVQVCEYTCYRGIFFDAQSWLAMWLRMCLALVPSFFIDPRGQFT